MQQVVPQKLEEILQKRESGGRLSVENAEMTGIFKKFVFVNVDFKKVKFFNAVFSKCQFIDCTFLDSHFIHSDFDFCKIDSCTLEDITIFTTKFQNSLFSVCKFANVVSTKIVFVKCKFEYLKFVCSNLIATKFNDCKFHDAKIIYSTLDGSSFVGCEFFDSVIESSSLRGVEISHCVVENSQMDFVDFSDSLNVLYSELYVPTKATIMQKNKVLNFNAQNIIIKKSLRGFAAHFKKRRLSFVKRLFVRKKSNTIKVQKQKTIKPKVEKKQRRFFPKNANGKNVASLLLFGLQIIATVVVVVLFWHLYKNTADVFYKSIPHYLELNLYFFTPFLEVHAFAFYVSLLYFVFSGLMLCLNVACVRGVKNIVLFALYWLQSVVTIVVLGWLWWCNLPFQLATLSYFNLVAFIYFCLMFYHSFGITSVRSLHEKLS